MRDTKVARLISCPERVVVCDSTIIGRSSYAQGFAAHDAKVDGRRENVGRVVRHRAKINGRTSY
jgi:hypothetical protein